MRTKRTLINMAYAVGSSLLLLLLGLVAGAQLPILQGCAAILTKPHVISSSVGLRFPSAGLVVRTRGSSTNFG